LTGVNFGAYASIVDAPPSSSPIQVVIARVRELRRQQGLSGATIAQRMTDLGIPWDRNTIAKLETGRRSSLSLDECLALALTLRVSPVALFLPDANEAYHITPNASATAEEVGRWLMGQRRLPTTTAAAELPPYLIDSLSIPDLEERFANMIKLADERFERYESHLRAVDQWIDTRLPALQELTGGSPPPSKRPRYGA
jgi:transcriptional regulator with XRE-family HTH domain